MISRFFPRTGNFFELFEKQVATAVEAAQFFKTVAAVGRVNEAMLSKIQAIEHEGDEVCHNIINLLNKTFITPFDREDILSLAKQIDDIVDMINGIISRLKVYNINDPDPNLIDFAKVIEESVLAVAQAVGGLRNPKHMERVSRACVEINRLENVGDAMRDRVLAELFTHGADPIHVIKWKDIYQDAETVLDVCEDVAHVVDSILVKQA